LALYDFAGMKKNSENDFENFDEDESAVCGQDFLVDLLGAVDALTPVINLMVEVQNLQSPGWKVVPYGETTLKLMEQMLEELKGSGETWSLSSNWPLLSSSINEVLDMSYRSVELVDGWLVQASNNKKIEWVCRQTEDCKADLELFLGKLISEVKTRLQNSVNEGVRLLHNAVDLSRLMSKVGGIWCTSMEDPLLQPTLDSDLENFRQFYGYIKRNQPGKVEENPDLVFAQVMSALK